MSNAFDKWKVSLTTGGDARDEEGWCIPLASIIL